MSPHISTRLSLAASLPSLFGSSVVASLAGSTMSAADLVTVLAEGTFEEQIVEASAFLSRSQAETSRNDFIARFQQLALEADPAAPSTDAQTESASASASADPVKKQHTVQQLVSEVKSLGEGTDRELEGVYNLLASLIASTDQQQQLLPTLVSAVANQATADKNNVRYRILSNLFNSLPSTSPLRLHIFKALLSLAAANDDLDYLSSALNTLPQWLAQWHVSEADKAACLESVAKALEAAEKEHAQTSKAYQFLLLHLRYISTLPDSPSTKDAAERTVAAALRFPQLYEYEDLLHIPAVLALNQASPVFDLLKIFVSGSTADFTAFASAHAAELERLNLSHDELLHKIRLLSLADLCALSVSSDVKYDSIAQTLNINQDEVEVWVIDVIRAGLVSGKLSQVNNAFRVYKSTHRQFAKQQWQQLESRLVQWQQSISSIIDSIAATRGGKLPADLVEAPSAQT